MNSFTKIPTLAVAFFAVVFAVGIFALASSVFAWGGYSGGDVTSGGSEGGNCCSSTPTPNPTPTPTPTPTQNPTPTPTPTPKPAVCVAFTFGGGATERTLPYGGGEVKLKWDTKNASSVSINNGIGSVSADGTKSLRVTKDTVFKLTAKGAGGNATCKVTVKVADAPKPATCDAFTVSKSNLPYGGGDVRLSWGTTNATSVSIDQGIGIVRADDSKTVHVTESKTFTLTAKGAGGNDTCKVAVKVAAPSAASCDAFIVNKSNLPYGGGDVTLSWNTTNAKSVSINQGIGSVSADGSKSVHVTASKTFTLTAVGDGGNDTCQVSVKVGSPANLSCDLFTVSKSHVEEGESFTLRWETTGADSVSINQGIGSVSADGDRTESVDDDTTYTLTAKRGNDEVTCTTSVRVEEDDEEDDDNLRCELDISDDEIERGDSVKLSWETEGGNEILLKDDHGNVLVDTDDGDDYDVDEDDIRVKPTRDTEYRLTVFDGNDKETCKVDVEVEDKDVSVRSDRDQDAIIIGIPLTHVPYTGFEAGPVLTALFYTLLAAWAFGVAYILVVKKGKIFGYSLPQKEAVAAATVASAPVYSPVANTATPVAEEEHVISALDTQAHEAHVLLSNDAREFISAQKATLEEQLALLDSIIANAKATFPTENGWVILNKVRVESLI